MRREVDGMSEHEKGKFYCPHCDGNIQFWPVGFKVVEWDTEEEPDLQKIALHEDWAKNLIYCDMDGFAFTEDGQLILKDDCNNVAVCPTGRFKVFWHYKMIVPKKEGEES